MNITYNKKVRKISNEYIDNSLFFSEIHLLGDICYKIQTSLNSIKEYYYDFFNTKSNQSIERYIEEFNSCYDKLIEICYNEKEYNLYISDKKRHEKIFNYVFYKNNLKSELFSKKDNLIKLNDKFHEEIVDITNTIFKLEKSVYPIVKDIWQNYITPIDQFDNNKDFKLLIKVVSNWRNLRNDEKIFEFLDKRIGTSTSLITNKKLAKFNCNTNNDYGFVYDIKDGFLAADSEDSVLIERIDGKDLINEDIKNKVSNLLTIYEKNNHQLLSLNASSIINTPENTLNEHSSAYNEVILNNKKSRPSAVFYYCYGHPLIAKDYENAHELSYKHNLPIIHLDTINTNQTSEYNDTSNKIKNIITDNRNIFESFIKSIAQYYINPKYLNRIDKINFNEAISIATMVIDKNIKNKTELKNMIIDYFKNYQYKNNKNIYQKFIFENNKNEDKNLSF